MKVYKCYFKYAPEYEYLGGYSFDDFQEMIILADSKKEAKKIFIETIRDCYGNRYNKHIELGLTVIEEQNQKSVVCIIAHL